jgi:hypothetical protein
MSVYKLYKTTGSDIPDAAIGFNEDGSTTSFIFDENNQDYQAYLKWVSEGGVPLPADE